MTTKAPGLRRTDDLRNDYDWASTLIESSTCTTSNNSAITFTSNRSRDTNASNFSMILPPWQVYKARFPLIPFSLQLLVQKPLYQKRNFTHAMYALSVPRSRLISNNVSAVYYMEFTCFREENSSVLCCSSAEIQNWSDDIQCSSNLVYVDVCFQRWICSNNDWRDCRVSLEAKVSDRFSTFLVSKMSLL